MLTSNKIHKFLGSLSKTKKFLVAYSGGLDSHVLLHLVSHCTDCQIRAVHIHHGLQSIADEWVQHCQKVCKALDISLDVVHLNLAPKKGESVEDIARKGRYLALERSLNSDEILLTAHHQNDQAETLLLQLFRGSGVQGLAAMPLISDFGSTQLIRPLLNETRLGLEDYADQFKLNYIEDPSNDDLIFDRNYLRKRILPQVRERWKGIDKTLSRAASIQAETKELLDDLAVDIFKNIHLANKNTVSIRSLSKLSKAKQKLVLRYWINRSGFSYPSEKKLDHIFKNVINASMDAQPIVEWTGAQLRRFKGELYIMKPLAEHDSSITIEWETKQSLNIASLGITLDSDMLESAGELVSVRFRQGGERLYPSNRGGSVSLKKILNEMGIPPWLRSRTPLIYSNNTLVQVLDPTKINKNSRESE